LNGIMIMRMSSADVDGAFHRVQSKTRSPSTGRR